MAEATVNQHVQQACMLMAKAETCRNALSGAMVSIYRDGDEMDRDRLRLALGSVGYRLLEELSSYEAQADAHVEEWTNG